jgi:hypothetical protein
MHFQEIFVSPSPIVTVTHPQVSATGYQSHDNSDTNVAWERSLDDGERNPKCPGCGCARE